MQTRRTTLRLKGAQHNSAQEPAPYATTSATELMEATFGVCRVHSRMDALSLPSGTGKTFFSNIHASASDGLVAVARIPGPGLASAQEAVIKSVAPRLLCPVQASFLDDDKIVEMPRALSIARERLPHFLRWSFAAWNQRSRGQKLLLIVDDLHALRLPASIDAFIRQIDEARAGFGIGVVYLGSQELLLTKFHAAQSLDRRFSRPGRLPSIKDAADRLSDQTPFHYSDLTDEDLTNYVLWLGYDASAAAQICRLRRERRLRPSFRRIKELLSEAAMAAGGRSIAEWLEHSVGGLPPSPRQIPRISRSAA